MPSPKGNTNAMQGDAPLASQMQARCTRTEKGNLVLLAKQIQKERQLDKFSVGELMREIVVDQVETMLRERGIEPYTEDQEGV